MVPSHEYVQKSYCQYSISTQLKMPQKGHHTAGAEPYYETPSNHYTENPVPRYLHYIIKCKRDFNFLIKDIGCTFKEGTNFHCLQRELLFNIYLFLTRPNIPISQNTDVQNKAVLKHYTINFISKQL